MIKNPNLSDCAIKVFQIWKKLTFEGKAKSELLEDFSDDSLNFYLNTLRELEIKLSLQDSKPHKISIVDNINLLNLNENDIEFLEKLKEVYDSVFFDEKIVGLSIGTRPDCVDSEKLDLISK